VVVELDRPGIRETKLREELHNFIISVDKPHAMPGLLFTTSSTSLLIDIRGL
jgi:hypothetical protein